MLTEENKPIVCRFKVYPQPKSNKYYFSLDQVGLKCLVEKLMKFVKKSDEISSVSGVPLLPIFKRCHHQLCPISISWESERYFDQTKFNWPVKFSEFFWWFYFSLQIISHFTSCRKCWNVLPRGNHAIMWGLFCQHFSLSKNGFRSRVSWVADRWGNNIQKCQLQRRPTIQLL